jgi:hypothetical protein
MALAHANVTVSCAAGGGYCTILRACVMLTDRRADICI